ncbi:MAG TPA: MBL fold metallo-hydrolase [Polyangiaceae bacterium]|nr:MBL fold metallo-hydrolase [Polyangiaceae bacterium]
MDTRWLFVSAISVALAPLAACGGGAEAAPPPEVPEAPAPAEATPPSEPAKPKLGLEVFTASPEGFLVTSTLISGEKDAVLIDAQFTLADAKAVAAKVKATNKQLTLVYVTHSHPDHYFGFGALKEAFPDVKLVALPATVAEIEKTWEGKVKQWKPLYKDGITDKPVVPEALQGTTLELEGETLELVGSVQGDEAENSYVWVPSLKAVIGGDIVYDEVFPWTAETTPESRRAWSASLDKLGALEPTTVVPGHQKPERQQEPANLSFTKSYLAAFDQSLAGSKTPEELQQKVKAQYPDAALDIVLKIGSEAAIQPAKKTAKK